MKLLTISSFVIFSFYFFDVSKAQNKVVETGSATLSNELDVSKIIASHPKAPVGSFILIQNQTNYEKLWIEVADNKSFNNTQTALSQKCFEILKAQSQTVIPIKLIYNPKAPPHTFQFDPSWEAELSTKTQTTIAHTNTLNTTTNQGNPFLSISNTTYNPTNVANPVTILPNNHSVNTYNNAHISHPNNQVTVKPTNTLILNTPKILTEKGKAQILKGKYSSSEMVVYHKACPKPQTITIINPKNQKKFSVWVAGRPYLKSYYPDVVVHISKKVAIQLELDTIDDDYEKLINIEVEYYKESLVNPYINLPLLNVEENGMAIMSNSAQKKAICWHKTAPIGTVVKVEKINIPSFNNHSNDPFLNVNSTSVAPYVYVEVIGELPENSQEDILIQLSEDAWKKLNTTNQGAIPVKVSYFWMD
jgi:rare lipoprotein A (peptidoglycan hydrolase)